MQRIQEIPAQVRNDAQNELYEKVTASRGMFFSPYKIWIHSPAVGLGMEMIGTHLNSSSSALSAPEMEMAVLVTARHWNAEYVIKNHAGHARKAGLDENIIEALIAGAIPPLNDERRRAVFDFTSSALKGHAISDDEFERYLSILTRAAIADILALIGYFTSVSLAMKTHAI